MRNCRAPRPAYGAVLDADTLASNTGAGEERASALVGMVGVLIAQGDAPAAARRITTSVARGDGGSSLLMLAAPFAPSLVTAADSVARVDSVRFGAMYERCPYPERSWVLSRYAAWRGRANVANAIAARLTQSLGTDTSALTRMFAHAAVAHALVASRDSARARAAFASLLAEPALEATMLNWFPSGGWGAERLAYAQLLLANGEAARARDVADVFDSPSPSSYTLYLAASLSLRASAADAMGDRAGAARYRARSDALAPRRTNR